MNLNGFMWMYVRGDFDRMNIQQIVIDFSTRGKNALVLFS